MVEIKERYEFLKGSIITDINIKENQCINSITIKKNNKVYIIESYEDDEELIVYAG